MCIALMQIGPPSLVPGLFKVLRSTQHHSKQSALIGLGHPVRLEGVQESTFFSFTTKPVHCSVNSSSIFFRCGLSGATSPEVRTADKILYHVRRQWLRRECKDGCQEQLSEFSTA